MTGDQHFASKRQHLICYGNRIVWTCCKNNDGELGARSAWERRNGLFVPVQDFDWKTFDGDGEKRRTVGLDDLECVV